MADKKDNGLKRWATLSGIGFQMIAIIGLGVFIGVKLDEYFEFEKLFTVIFSLSSVIISIYFVVRQVIKKSIK